MNDEKSVRKARAEMEEARRQTEGLSETGERLPRRYKLYDKIKDKVSLRTVDTVIIITAGLIVVLLIVGMVTGRH